MSVEALAVYCWCERRIIHVAPDVIRAGETRSCSHPLCCPAYDPTTDPHPRDLTA